MSATRQFGSVFRISVVVGILIATGAVTLRLWGTGRSIPSLSITQAQRLLPPGGILHSLARLELDGRSPPEAAAVVIIPKFPGSSESIYYAFLFGYDRWQRQYRVLHTLLVPGPVLIPADAIRLSGPREAAVFSTLDADGTLSYWIVGMARGIRILREGHVRGRLLVDDAILVEEGSPRRALAWDGRAFREREVPRLVSAPPLGTTWRYRVQNDTILARSSVAHLRPRQPLRLAGTGGGPIPVILPDARLDLVGTNVFRARHQGTYAINILIPFNPPGETYRLTLIVE